MSSHPTTSLPEMAQFKNVVIQGGTFNSAKGDIQINNREFGLQVLSQAVSHGAIHDSAERYPPPNCHPDTRMAVRQIILDWIHNESSALPFLWLYGPAGAGKTAILQAIAEFLCSSSRNYENFGGSFFFSRGKDGRDQGHFLFSTIAYQLALNVPGLRQHTNRIMDAKPTLHTKSIDVQLQTLIVDALQCLSPLPQRCYLVIIDGLDECQDKATQQHILRLLCETITAHKLRLRFLIGSRPESHIRTCFDQEALCTITERVVLDETFNPGRDIQVFLQDGFAEICAKHADILTHVKQPWPTKGIIDLLVQRSSGQFIYAATVLKFVGADFYSPTKQLELVLIPDPTAFSDLDQLYTQILSVYPSAATIVQVLGIILVFDAGTLTPEVIEDILEMEEGEVRHVLRGLSSLIAFVGDKDEKYLTKEIHASTFGSVYFIHASFRDFLVDSSRSGPFHVNEQEHKNKATIRSFDLITKWIRRPWRIHSTTRLPHSATWGYVKFHLPSRFIASPKLVKDAIMTDINELTQEFWEISNTGAVDVFFTAMLCLMWILERTLPPATDYQLFGVFHGFQKMIDQSFIESVDISDLLRLLPGVVVQKGLSIQGVADLYRLKMDLLDRFSKSALEPFVLPERPFYVLWNYLSAFFMDPHRSHLFHCDPILHHVLICRQLFSLLDGSNFQSDELVNYVQCNLDHHLCVVTKDFHSGESIPGDHLAVQLLNNLDGATYYDAHQSRLISPLLTSPLAAYTIRTVLRWADTLNCHLKHAIVSISSINLIERLGQITDRIYRQILCIETHGGMTTITMCAPIREVYMIPDTRPRRADIVQLSWGLLVERSINGRISSFFTDFMTTPERSGSLYMSPDVYHTQITEYSLETIFRSQNIVRPSPFSLYDYCYFIVDWSFEEHISRALPSEMIICLLRSISTRLLVRDGTVLEIIVKWLEGLGSERPNDLYDRFQAALAAL
ncbi:hypothetical protein BYT27DRAFT_7182054 [Phlegmacium glaucopus]|nr:hypothetical protein BYT27DRAFT_7182054 [Phlegmacium glaucopus]